MEGEGDPPTAPPGPGALLDDGLSTSGAAEEAGMDAEALAQRRWPVAGWLAQGPAQHAAE